MRADPSAVSTTSCVTGAGSELRKPSALELEMCRYQGEHVAKIVADLVAGRAPRK